METAEITTAAGRVGALIDEYVELLATKARSDGLDNHKEQRLRALAKEPVIGRDLRRDMDTASILWQFKRDKVATLPDRNPTNAELSAAIEAVEVANRTRMNAQVELEVHQFRLKRQAAYGVRQDPDVASDAAKKLNAAVGVALVGANRARQAWDVAQAIPRARAAAAEFPELAAKLGLTTEPPPAPKRRPRSSD